MTLFNFNYLLIILATLLYQSNGSTISDADFFGKVTDIHYRTCSEYPRCNGMAEEDRPVYGDWEGPCCKECSCDDSCIEFGTCCPDQLDNMMQNNEVLQTQKRVCALPKLRKGFRADDGIWMVQFCPISFSNETIKDLCHNRSSQDSLEDAAPVTSRNGDHTTYFNIYCAMCNNLTEKDVIHWMPSKLECVEGFFFPQSKEKLIQNIWNTKCNVDYSLPDNVSLNIPGCYPYISQCNVTGLWKEYDQYIETACNSYTSVYNGTYRNVFCYLCNEVKEPGSVCFWSTTPNVFVSFSALLNFAADSERNTKPSPTLLDHGCAKDYVYDEFQMKCLQVECYYGRRYYNGSCQKETLQNMAGLYYQINIKLSPQNQVPEEKSLEIGESLYQELKIILLPSKENQPTVSVCRGAVYYVNETNSGFFRFELEVGNVKPETADEFVETALDLDQAYQQFRSGNETLDVYLELYTEPISTTKTVEQSVIQKGHTLLTLEEDVYRCITEAKRARISITRAMRCPLIKLHKNQITWEVKDFGIFFVQLDLFVFSNNILKEDDDTALLCMDVYLPKANEVAAQRSKTKAGSVIVVSPVGYLSFVCVILSVMCLLVTILTYALFKELQTQPGINNITLSCALIAAQSLFQFTIGLKGKILHGACACFGALTHFFWLYAIFWMNVSCIHMTRVFRKTSLQDHKYKAKTIIKYNIYTALTSSFFCLLNIVGSYIKSGGNSLGYGDADKCYISSNLMLGLTFAFPVGAVVIINLCLFFFTVVHLSRLSEAVTTNQHNRSMFLIYVRLSSVTGLTWLFGFLYTFTSLSIFEYVFAIFNGGQGVLIFLAFVINKRVLRMYKSLLCKQKKKVVQK